MKNILFMLFTILLVGCSTVSNDVLEEDHPHDEEGNHIYDGDKELEHSDKIIESEHNFEDLSDFSYIEIFSNGVVASENNNFITVKTNAIPDHDTGDFPNSGNPNTISEQDLEFSFSLSPEKTGNFFESKGYVFGVAINGIPIEPLTGEFYDNDRNSGWNLEWSSNNLGFDFNNAHVQPDGTYHYHGAPSSLLSSLGDGEKVLVGFAADGFPIYFEDLKSSYQIKSGTRSSGPLGTYDGTYVEDYEFVSGLGDLDECNGLSGETLEFGETYYYVISETFPIVSRCYVGTPDISFKHTASGDSNLQQGQSQNGDVSGNQQLNSPPEESISACSGSSVGVSCSFETPNGIQSGNCRDIENSLACVPSNR
jgi:hypothetical protein